MPTGTMAPAFERSKQHWRTMHDTVLVGTAGAASDRSREVGMCVMR